jgi:hypothetical protein
MDWASFLAANSVEKSASPNTEEQKSGPSLTQLPETPRCGKSCVVLVAVIELILRSSFPNAVE